jgi:hypothetical protein
MAEGELGVRAEAVGHHQVRAVRREAVPACFRVHDLLQVDWEGVRRIAVSVWLRRVAASVVALDEQPPAALGVEKKGPETFLP